MKYHCGSTGTFKRTALLGVGLLLAGTTGLRAAVIVPGSVLIPAAAEPDPVGGVVVAAATVPFAVPGAFSGTLSSQVIAGDASNPLGGLTFVYQVSNDGVAGPNSIGRLVLGGFTGFVTDASYEVPATGVAPGLIDRNVAGDTVGFTFIPTPFDPLSGFLVPGASSAWLVLQTDAPLYGPQLASIIDGGITSAASWGPTLIPEPTQGGLLAAVGLAGFVLSRRTRRG